MTQGQEAPAKASRRLTPEQIQEIKQARIFLHRLFSVIRTAAYHAANNIALEEPAAAFVQIQAWHHDKLGAFKIEVGQGQMFINTSRVRPAPKQQAAIDGLVKFVNRRGLGGLFFHEAMDLEQVKLFFTTLATFQKPLLATNGVEEMERTLESLGLGSVLTPLPPMDVNIKDTSERLKDLGDAGRNAVLLAKGAAMVKAAAVDDSEVARAGARHVVRQMSDLNDEERDMALGMSMMGGSQDMGMRSLTILLVAQAMADALHMPRALRADLGQACLELMRWDEGIRTRGLGPDRDMDGAQALQWLTEQKTWSVGTLRQGLALAGRYMKPRAQQSTGTPGASRLSEILRAASDYVDLTLPTPMRDLEPFLEGGPFAPHEALQRMRRQIDKRYSRPVLASLARGVGILPVGTPVEMMDGCGAVVLERTEDNLTFEVQENLSGKKRRASFLPGPDQIRRVIIGGDLLKVRSRFLLGDDHEPLEEIARELIEEAIEVKNKS